MGVSRMTLLYGSAAVMVASFILSSTFNDLWLGANYNKGVETVKIGHDCVSNGYTKWQFVGLLVSVYLYPAAAIAMAVFMSAVYNNIELSKSVRLVLLGICALMSFVLAGVVYWEWARDIWACGVIFCPWSSAPDDPENFGYRETLGSIIIFVLSAITIAALSMIYFTKYPAEASYAPSAAMPRGSNPYARIANEPGTVRASSGRDASLNTRIHPRQHAQQAAEKKRNRRFWLITVFLVFYPFLLFLCSLLPNQWIYFTRYYLAKETGDNSADAELSDSDFFQTISVSLGGGVYLNIFPDVVLFYSFLYAVVLLGLLSLQSARVHKLMHTRLRLRLPCAGASTAYYTYVSCGALIFAFLFLVLFALWVCYWALNHDFAYSGGDISLAELWARVFGQIGNLFLALLILPQSRNSIWSHTFGVSWEDMLTFHIWMAYGYLLSILAHMFCWWKVYDEQNSFPYDILAVPMYYPDGGGYSSPCGDDFTIPLAVVTFFVALIVFGVLASHWVRRGHFELFYYSHHFFMVVFLVNLIHATSCWYFLLGGLTLWAADRVVRYYKGVRGRVHNAEFALHGPDRGITEIFIPGCVDFAASESHRARGHGHDNGDSNARGNSNGNGNGNGRVIRTMFGTFTQGQFAFINIPSISTLEWHPFTISSAPCDGFVSFHIKDMGVGTWTGKLNEMARQYVAEGAYGAGASAAAPVEPALNMQWAEEEDDDSGSGGGSERRNYVVSSAGVGGGDDSSSARRRRVSVNSSINSSINRESINSSINRESISINRESISINRESISIMSDESSSMHADLARSNKYQIIVDGPVGCPFDHTRYDKLVLIGGGIGITPCHSTFRQLYALARSRLSDTDVHLVWVTKQKEHLGMFSSTLQSVRENGLGGRFTYSLYVTRKRDGGEGGGDGGGNAHRNGNGNGDGNGNGNGNGDSDGHGAADGRGTRERKEEDGGNDRHRDNAVSSSHRVLSADGGAFDIPFQYGRPDLRSDISELSDEQRYSGRRVMVHCVGPKTLVAVASDLAYEYGVEFTTTTFEL